MEKKVLDVIRINNPKFKGSCSETNIITILESRGIRAEYCIDSRLIKAYLFDPKEWTDDDAKDWVSEHAKDYEGGEIKAEVGMRNGKMVAIASTEDRDRDGEVIKMSGWDLKSFIKNPVLLWQHNMNMAHNGLPIGKAENIQVVEDNGRKVLQFEPVFDDTTEFNRTVKKFYEEGIMSAFSVGFMGLEREGKTFVKQELLEISAVPVPANSNAEIVQRAIKAGINKKSVMKVLDMKRAIPFKSFELANESKEWDSFSSESRVRQYAGGPDKSNIDFDMYSEAFGYWDETKKSDFSKYKFIHHDSEGSELVTVWRGVKSAMAQLIRDTELNDHEKKDVYDHLAKHYEEFDKTAPDFKAVTCEALKEILSEVEQETKIRDYRETKKHLRSIRNAIRERDSKKEENIIYDAEMVEALKILNHSTSIALKRVKSLKEGQLTGKEEK